MQTASAENQRAKSRGIPAELGAMAGTAGGLLAVTATGAAISGILPAPASPWLSAAAYAVPAAVAFVVYWWIAQRL